MSSNLAHRQSKIQEKRKQTPFRSFLIEIASRWSISMYKHNGTTGVFPDTIRSGNIVDLKEYHEKYDTIMKNQSFKGNFLQEMQEFFRNHTKPGLIHFASNDNANFCHCGFGVKDAYLSFVAGLKAENILYSTQVRENVTNIINSSLIFNGSTNIYHSRSITGSFNIFYSQYIHNCSDMLFCSSCIGCNRCIECHDLDNKSYCIKNTQYSKEEYETIKKTYTQDIYIQKHKETFSRKGKNLISTDVSGAGLYKCDNVTNGFNTSNYKNSNNIIFSEGLNGCSEFYDCMDTGNDSHNFYGICYGGEFSNHCYMGCLNSRCDNVYYSYYLESCSFCLGCIGLKNKSFCIFNTQYTKGERYTKVDEIFSQMDADGTLGNFFPATMNPFYFNDTAAYLIDPSFTKEEVTAAGYLRRDEPIKVDIPADAQIIQSKDLGSFESLDAEGNRLINADILKKVIQDDLGNYYRIIPMEYKFLMKHALPLPRKHWLERMKENFRIG